MLGQTWHKAPGLKDGLDPECVCKSKVGEGYLCATAIFCGFRKQDLCLTDSSRVVTVYVCVCVCVVLHAPV